jgi:hypothetical protein
MIKFKMIKNLLYQLILDCRVNNAQMVATGSYSLELVVKTFY